MDPRENFTSELQSRDSAACGAIASTLQGWCQLDWAVLIQHPCRARQKGMGPSHTFMSVDAVAIRLGTPGLKDIAQVAASCAESLNRGAEPGPNLAS